MPPKDEPPQFYTEKSIFQGARNGIIDCMTNGCEWTFFGPRQMFQQAWNEHWRMCHSQEIGVAFVHQPATPQIIIAR